MIRPLELLAPARNLECGIAAIDHGADAVYIGAQRFGARAAAGNSVADIASLCRYAHQFGAKVYVTVNTIIYDDELEDTRRLLSDLQQAHVDAILVQDMAIVSELPLHASTQTDNRTADKVLWLSQQGFSRVVLARELSIDEIRAIHEAVPGVELEVFVHGALCVSYSGQCYASQYCFGRSANRGECAQVCRMQFDLVDSDGTVIEHDRHLLSLKDLCRIDHLEALADAGATSFKIEGRLKDVAYVKNVTAAYSERLNQIVRQHPDRYCRASKGRITYTFTPNLAKTFNRGYTDYFATGRRPDIASFDTPKAMGEFVGIVKELRRDSFNVAGTASFSNGDGLCFLDAEGRLQGFRVNRAEGNHLYTADPHQTFPLRGGREGSVLWRSYDRQWERLMEGQTAERRIEARFLLEETEQGFRLTFTAQDGTHRSKEFAAEHQPARNDQTASVRDVLSKLGDTPYRCTDVEVRFSQPWFIPRSLLAEWRRETTRQSPLNNEHSALPKDAQRPTPNAQRSILNGQCSTVNESSPLMTCCFCLRHAWGMCKKDRASSKPGSKWTEPLFLVLGDGRRFRLEFDCRKCEMTVWAAQKRQGKFPT